MERKIILNILKARKYKLPDDTEEFINSTSEEFLTHRILDPDDKIYVFFPESPKVGVSTVKQYIKSMENEKVNRAIIIVDNITTFSRQLSDQYTNLYIEYFKRNELIIDKMSHILVPKHELISDEEKKELLSLYKCKDIHLPKIYNTDPIAKYFGAKKGQVFKITRHSETSGESIYYRIVV